MSSTTPPLKYTLAVFLDDPKMMESWRKRHGEEVARELALEVSADKLDKLFFRVLAVCSELGLRANLCEEEKS